MKKVEFSNHALFDREERIVWIATEVGFGEVIDTIVIYDEERNCRRVELTETGVAIIKPLTKSLLSLCICLLSANWLSGTAPRTLCRFAC